MAGWGDQERMKVTKTNKNRIKKIFETVQISDWETLISDAAHTNPDLDYKNPYSKISCLVVYLYSMELGDPPLYAEVNRVTRDMDTCLLEFLGPYINVLYFVLSWGETNKAKDDKIKTG